MFLKRLFRSLQTDIGVDLGTGSTRIFVRDKGIIIDEPTIVAINNKTNQILSVGHEAKHMLGKTPAHITVTRPLSSGIISDYEVAEKLLTYLFDKVREDLGSAFVRPRVVIAVPLEVTEVEVKAVEDVVISAGAREVVVVEEPVAAAVGARMPIGESIGNMIVHIGAGTTEIAVISLNGVVTWKSTRVAGDELTKNITQYAREVFNLYTGESYAEQVKLKIGTASRPLDRQEFPLRGRDVITGLPKEIMITSDHVYEALERSVRTIVEQIKMTLERTPPELTADIHERGLLLSGGGALLPGLEAVIARATEIPVRVADDPQTTVVRGTGILIDSPDILKEVRLPSARESARAK